MCIINNETVLQQQSEIFMELTDNFPWIIDMVKEDQDFAKFFFKVIEGQHPITVLRDSIIFQKELMEITIKNYKMLNDVYQTEIKRLEEEIKSFKDGL